ncbi:hypothetical protein AB6A40_000653 [Gnathostoma spinigerum]|uniref:Uncharacterized protein n=1 Tax=Gnathostoma spinigerum TaxID=75299 RepID=A0ABD6E706_9BILA
MSEELLSHLRFDRIPPPQQSSDEIRKNLDGTPGKRYFDEVRPITEAEVREALLREAKRHKYWKSNVVNKMIFDKIENMSCLHYALESFTETRSTSKATEGVTIGQFLEHQPSNNFRSSISGNGCGLIANPWDYEILPNENFVEQVKVIEMPNSSELSACSSCNAEGLSHCFYCRGYGTDKCTYCRGTGMKAGVAHPAVYTHPLIGTFPHSDLARGYPASGTAMIRPQSGGLAYGVGTPIHFMAKAGVPPPGIGHHDFCYFCHGRGINECSHCKGHGKKPCSSCGGSGSVRTYTKLRIAFGLERSEFFTECEIPEKLLRNVKGQVLFDEERPYVLPLKKYPVQLINDKSREMCKAHLQKCLGTCRIIMQRHCLIAIPIAKVTYHLGSRSEFFWIYGTEHSCYAPKYPSKCCLL